MSSPYFELYLGFGVNITDLSEEKFKYLKNKCNFSDKDLIILRSFKNILNDNDTNEFTISIDDQTITLFKPSNYSGYFVIGVRTDSIDLYNHQRKGQGLMLPNKETLKLVKSIQKKLKLGLTETVTTYWQYIW